MTVRLVMNILKPDQGEIEFSLHINKSLQIPHVSELGYLPEERGLYQEIPIITTLVYMGIIRGMEKKQAEKSEIASSPIRQICKDCFFNI